MHQHYRFMIGHGAVVMFIAMLVGVGLLVKLVGGLELIPSHIIAVEFPGTSGAWARAHVGGLLNGILIIVAAMAAHLLSASDKVRGQLRWMLMGTGYANTVFYIGALFANNRALTLGDNHFGETSAIAIIAYLPALVFTVISLIAVYILAKEAFCGGEGTQ